MKTLKLKKGPHKGWFVNGLEHGIHMDGSTKGWMRWGKLHGKIEVITDKGVFKKGSKANIFMGQHMGHFDLSKNNDSLHMLSTIIGDLRNSGIAYGR